jgi:hypothetical protein
VRRVWPECPYELDDAGNNLLCKPQAAAVAVTAGRVDAPMADAPGVKTITALNGELTALAAALGAQRSAAGSPDAEPTALPSWSPSQDGESPTPTGPVGASPTADPTASPTADPAASSDAQSTTGVENSTRGSSAPAVESSTPESRAGPGQGRASTPTMPVVPPIARRKPPVEPTGQRDAGPDPMIQALTLAMSQLSSSVLAWQSAMQAQGAAPRSESAPGPTPDNDGTAPQSEPASDSAPETDGVARRIRFVAPSRQPTPSGDSAKRSAPIGAVAPTGEFPAVRDDVREPCEPND